MTLTDEDVMAWQPLVRKIAGSYWRRMAMRPELEDYIGEGFVGLILGLREYDAARCPNKKAYLSTRIAWAIVRAIRRDNIVKRRGHERGVRAGMHSFAELEAEVFAHHGREIEKRMAVLDLDTLFSVMLEEERAEFAALLAKAPDPRRAATKRGGYPEDNARWDARTFARPRRFVSKNLVAGFARMQNVLRLHRTAV